MATAAAHPPERPFRIEQVTAAETASLRQVVLRPHATIEELVAAGAADPHAAHFAALDDHEVIATGFVGQEAPPWPSDRAPFWRLRGMATAEGRRGAGVGTALLATAVDHVRREGGRLLWCNARIPAIGLYQRAGFVTRGGPWQDPVLGPHIAMELLIERAGSTGA